VPTAALIKSAILAGLPATAAAAASAAGGIARRIARMDYSSSFA
jgi:hypothetical protein